MQFGRRLRELRKEKGLTLEVLAAKIGSSKGYLSGIENEKVNPPTERFVRKLARIFGQDEIEFLKVAYLDKIPKALQGELREALGTTSGAGPDAAAPAPKRRPGEDSGIVPCRVPLLNNAAGGYPDRIDSRGFPQTIINESVVIPGVHPTNTFAITVCGHAMAGEEEPRLRQGDIALVSRTGRVESGDVVFAVFTEKGRRQGAIRQVMLQDGETVALQASNREHPIIFVKRGDIDGLFKVIGRIEFFRGSVPDNVSERQPAANGGV